MCRKDDIKLQCYFFHQKVSKLQKTKTENSDKRTVMALMMMESFNTFGWIIID